MKVAATGEDSGSFLLRNKWLAPQSSNQKLTVDQYGKFVRPTWTKAQSVQWTLSPHVKLPIDHSQRPASFSYCCDVWQAMPLSRHTTRSHAVKNTSWSKEETENMLTDKKEQVNELWQIAIASVQAARELIISSSLLVIAQNKHEQTSEGILFQLHAERRQYTLSSSLSPPMLI